MGRGGLATCTDPEAAAPQPWTESQLGPGFWAYGMCSDQPAHQSINARWCTAAGGTWVGNVGSPHCENMPPDILGTPYATSDEGRSVSISDSFASGYCTPTSVDDTGWGTTLPLGSGECPYGGTGVNATVVVREIRKRLYHYSCRSDLGIVLERRRGVKCPFGYQSRT